MRLVVQRVEKASVEAGGRVVGEINQGLFVLLGIKKEDTEKQVDSLVEKLVKLRIMADESDKMNLSVKDTDSSILVVSQFTLYANTKNGNRPSFLDAEEPKKAKELYKYFVEKLQENNIGTQTGSFGDYMKIKTKLDGPVTIVLEN